MKKKKTQTNKTKNPTPNLMLQNTSHFQNNKSLCIKFRKQNLRGCLFLNVTKDLQNFVESEVSESFCFTWLCLHSSVSKLHNNPFLEWLVSFYARAAHAVSLVISLSQIPQSFAIIRITLNKNKRSLSWAVGTTSGLIPRVQENNEQQLGRKDRLNYGQK